VINSNLWSNRTVTSPSDDTIQAGVPTTTKTFVCSSVVSRIKLLARAQYNGLQNERVRRDPVLISHVTNSKRERITLPACFKATTIIRVYSVYDIYHSKTNEHVLSMNANDRLQQLVWGPIQPRRGGDCIAVSVAPSALIRPATKTELCYMAAMVFCLIRPSSCSPINEPCLVNPYVKWISRFKGL